MTPDEFNDHFVDKVGKIRRSLDGAPPPALRRLDPDQPRLSKFRPVMSGDVAAVMAAVKPSASEGTDGLPMNVLRAAGPGLHPHLARLANAVVDAGWPPQWREAVVQGVWKKRGPREDSASYRPVSNLPAVSKVVERLLLPQITGQFENVGLLPDSQLGSGRGGPAKPHSRT